MADTKGFPLKEFYSRIHKNYDLINRLFTFKMDEKWRKRTAQECLKDSPAEILDLCCGTGDLTIRLATGSSSETQITGYDFSSGMLEMAKKKAGVLNIGKLKFIEGDAAQMPFERAQFDVIGITFGFRNLSFQNPNEALHLAEIVRVLKPGGKLVILESGYPENKFVKFFYKLYLNAVLIPLGGLISGDMEAYRYLARSSSLFYTSAELKQKLLSAGFKYFEHQAMLFGASNIFIAKK